MIATITNLQGDTFTDAVVSILDATYNSNDSKNLSFDMGEPVLSGYTSNNLRYRVAYWATQENRDAGDSPYILDSANPYEGVDMRSVDDKLWHTASDLDSTFTDLDLVAMCEKHLVDVVLA